MELFIDGPEGRLEALLDLPDGDDSPRAAAVVCHPHPAHGGTMHNTVVFRTARGLREAGVATLRFNFRGTEASEGEHDGEGAEVGDARAALDWLEARYPGLELWGAGFSFGSRMIYALGLEDERLKRLVLVSIPTGVYECDGLENVRQPTYVQLAGNDEYGTLADFQTRLPNPPPHFEIHEIPDTDHFFRRKTPILQANVARYARESLDSTSR